MTPWEIYAVRYAHNPNAKRSTNFIGGDPHDAPMPLDYFVWAIRSESRTIILDTGFDEPMGLKRNRQFLRSPALLARHAGAPMIPIAIVRTGRSHYHLHTGEPIRVGGVREEAGLIAATQQVADYFAGFIRKHPDHWFNFYDYFSAAARLD